MIVIQRAIGFNIFLQAANAPAYPAQNIAPLNADVYMAYADDPTNRSYVGTFPLDTKVKIPLPPDQDRDVIVTAVARSGVGVQHVNDVADGVSLTIESQREQRVPIVAQTGSSTNDKVVLGIGRFPRHMRARRIRIATDAAFTNVINTVYQDIDKSGMEVPRLSEQVALFRTPGMAATTYYVKVSHSSFSTLLAQGATQLDKLASLRWGPESPAFAITYAAPDGTGGASGAYNPFASGFNITGAGEFTAGIVPLPADPSFGVGGKNDGLGDRLAIWDPNVSNSLTYSSPIQANRTTGRVAANGYTLPSSVSLLGGSGDPEGVETANPGSRYFRADGSRYKKASGTGNTGWVTEPNGHGLKNQSTPVTLRPDISIPQYHPFTFADDAGNNQTLLKAAFLETAVRNLVTDFGADPLGVSDCSTALQNAINSYSRIVIPAGTYKFATTINIPTANPGSAFILEGHGQGSTLLQFNGTGHAFQAPNGASDCWMMRNLRLECINVSNAGDGLHLIGNSSSVNTHLLIENVAIFKFGRWAVNADNLQSSILRNCHLRQNKAGHIKLVDPSVVDPVKEPNANVIEGCLLDNTPADDQNVASIYLYNANGTRISGCTIQGNYSGTTGNIQAIYADHCDSLVLDNVWVENLPAGPQTPAVKLVNCRAALISGYHGSGTHTWDFHLLNSKSVTFRGCTLTNSVPHFVCENSFYVGVYGSVLTHPESVINGDAPDHTYIHSDCHYHSNADLNYKEYGSSWALYNGLGQNWIDNPNLVDDSNGWTLNGTYISRVATGSPSGIGGYFKYTPGAGSGTLTGLTVLEQTVSIPDSVPAGFWTVAWDYHIEDDGAANDVNARVGFSVTATGASEFTTYYKNQLNNFLPVGKWVRNSIAVWLAAGSSRTIRVRINPDQTYKGANTPTVRFANFRLTPGADGQAGGHVLWAEDRVNYLRQPIFAPARPSTGSPPSGYGGLRWNGSNWQEFKSGAWQNIGGASGVTGTGTSGNMAKFTGASAVGDSILSESGSLIRFAGATSSFPALKRSSAELQVRLADDSAYAVLRALDVNAQGNLSVTGLASIGGNTSIDVAGSSTGSPRLLGLSNIASGNAARFQFGDGFNSIQNSYSGRMVIQSFHGLKIYGHTYGVTTGSEAPVGFSSNDVTDPHVEFIGSNGGFSENLADNTHVQIRGASSMVAGVTSFLRCVTSGGTERFTVLEDGKVRIAGAQVLGPRKTGWTAPTGTPTRTGFATGSATLQQVAEALKAVIDDLISHGILGA
jgi:hypothetical protein